jgi:hypothetical protein
MEVFLKLIGLRNSPKHLVFLGGRYWVRTSDLFRVKETSWCLFEELREDYYQINLVIIIF